MTQSSEAISALQPTLDEEHAEAVVEFRRVTKKAPLTAFGAKLLAKQLAAWHDPNEAAEIMITRCWQGFKAEWVRDQPRYSPALRGLAAIEQNLKLEIENGYRDGEKGFDREIDAGFPLLAIADHRRQH